MRRPTLAPPLPWLLATLSLALAYAALSVLALRYGPDYAVSFFPAAGVALGAVLVWGPGLLPGVLLGALAANVVMAGGLDALIARGLWLPCSLALVKALHAGVGAWLLRRWGGEPLRLDTLRAVVRFIVLVAAGCALGASLATLLLALYGIVGSTDIVPTWTTWWLGDTMGVLIVAPIVLALFGQPRAYWGPRRFGFALPQTLLTVVVLAASAQVAEWDAARVRQELTRDAERIAASVQRGLSQPAMSLRIAAMQLGRSDIGEVIALQEAERLWGAQAPAVLSSGWAPFRPGTASASGRLQPEREAVHSLPPQMAGVDLWQLPGAPQALQAAAARGAVAALGPLPGMRLVLAMPIAEGPARDRADPWSRVTGVLFAVLSAERLLAEALVGAESGLSACLVDRGLSGAPRALGGPLACLAPPMRQPQQRDIAVDLPDSRWVTRVVAAPAYVREHRSWAGLVLMQGSLFGAFGVGMFLLAVAARSERDTARADRSEALLDETLQAAPFGVVMFDMHEKSVRVNAAYSELTGYTADELQAMSINLREITHPDDRADDDAQSNAILTGRGAQTFEREKRYVRKDGSVVHVHVQNAIRRDAQGRPTAVLGVVRDITERQRMAELEQAAQRAEAANRAKTDFLSRMSHELRTPLNAMLGFTQLMVHDDLATLSARQRERLSLIEKAGWHLLAMIEEVLDLSRIESGSLHLSMEPVDLGGLLRDAVHSLAPDADREQVRLVGPDVAADAGTVLADATRLRQVIANLLGNAVKYNREGGTVEVSARRVDADRVSICVRDSGLGLSAEQLAHLFEPFNRLGRESSSKPGTGIGLAITRRLVEFMGGDIEASSEVGRGSSFVVRLRAAQPAQAKVHTARALPAADYAAASILYIEDNEVNVELMAAVLSQRPQLRMRACLSGAEGLAALRDGSHFDLVLLDMHLPDTHGLLILAQMKREPSTAGIPVIAVSADAMSGQVQAALHAGAVAYLTKPLNVGDTLREVDRVLARQRPTATLA